MCACWESLVGFVFMTFAQSSAPVETNSCNRSPVFTGERCRDVAYCCGVWRLVNWGMNSTDPATDSKQVVLDYWLQTIFSALP